MKSFNIVLLASALASVFLFLPFTANATPLSETQIDALAERARSELDVPGIALAVVEDGKIIHAKGYGVKLVSDNDKVTPNTLFQIASLTKAFKTAGLAILVDQGKLNWDSKIIDYLPEFQMYDPWVTKEFTVRDMLTHRSGLPLGAGDLLQWPTVVATPREMMHALRHLKPSTSFRSSYAYDNLMYVMAGEVISTVSGIPWQDYIQEQVLTPLDMKGCTTRPKDIIDTSNRAVPHMVVNGKITPTFFKDGPSIICNITGMAQWGMMHLAHGQKTDGNTLISAKQQQEMWTPVTLKPILRIAKKYSRTHFTAYGLGWNIMAFQGFLHISHGGAVQGMTSHMAFLPEKQVAVIALTNQWSRAAQGLTATILDSYVSDTPKDYIEMYSDGYKRGMAANRDRQKAVQETVEAGQPQSLPLKAYVGTYKDAWYGDIFVSEKDEQLHIQFGRTDVLGGPLIPYDKETFIARWSDRSLNADAYVDFILSKDGAIEGIRMKAVDPSTDFSYDFHHLEPVRIEENLEE